MAEASGEVGPGVGRSRDSDQVREEIEEARHDLGATVASLARKTDVKAQTKHRLADVKGTVQDKATAAKRMTASKRDEVARRAKEVSPESASEGAQRAVRAARENPARLAALGSFVAGIVFGRVLGRKKNRTDS